MATKKKNAKKVTAKKTAKTKRQEAKMLAEKAEQVVKKILQSKRPVLAIDGEKLHELLDLLPGELQVRVMTALLYRIVQEIFPNPVVAVEAAHRLEGIAFERMIQFVNDMMTDASGLGSAAEMFNNPAALFELLRKAAGEEEPKKKKSARKVGSADEAPEPEGVPETEPEDTPELEPDDSDTVEIIGATGSEG